VLHIAQSHQAKHTAHLNRNSRQIPNPCLACGPQGVVHTVEQAAHQKDSTGQQRLPVVMPMTIRPQDASLSSYKTSRECLSHAGNETKPVSTTTAAVTQPLQQQGQPLQWPVIRCTCRLLLLVRCKCTNTLRPVAQVVGIKRGQQQSPA
jgi:hypothetical protein